jgi:hypothetical protein
LHTLGELANHPGLVPQKAVPVVREGIENHADDQTDARGWPKNFHACSPVCLRKTIELSAILAPGMEIGIRYFRPACGRLALPEKHGVRE